MTTPLSPDSLAALRILVIEDEFFLADDMARSIEAAGAEVVGPAGTLQGASLLLDQSVPDCAIVDLNLHGEDSAPLARRLRAAGVPFLLATGYSAEALPPDLVDAPHLEKPFDARHALAALRALLASPAPAETH